MLRPVGAMVTLLASVLLLGPAVTQAHHELDALDIRREIPWRLWKHTAPDAPPASPRCGPYPLPMESEVTEWPRRVVKHEAFELGGEVVSPQEGSRGVGGVRVDLFLNETKTEPGIPIGSTVTDEQGIFRLEGAFPTDLLADRYHLVAHAHEKTEGCKRYEEHWSDPAMEVVAPTRIEMTLPRAVVVGDRINVSGQLLDSAGGAVPNATLSVSGAVKGRLTTDEDGTFSFSTYAKKAGERHFTVSYLGSRYYGRSSVSADVMVEANAIVIDREPSGMAEFVRSQPGTITGRVVGEDDATEVEIDLVGLRAAACPACNATSTFVVPVEEGRFRLPLTVPSSEPAGLFEIHARVPGADAASRYFGQVRAPVELDLSASGEKFSRAYDIRVAARDDRGAPVGGTVIVYGPVGELPLALDEDGRARASGSAPCGAYDVGAEYPSDGTTSGDEDAAALQVCPALAWLPDWVWGVPWWAYSLLLPLPPLLYFLARRIQERRAPTLAWGPPLALEIREPADEAPSVIGLGERAVVAARLEAPLPEGHMLRFVRRDRGSTVDPGDAVEATQTILPDCLGDLRVRAEIVSPAGRVVTRRTIVLRVVDYAAEIERVHLEAERRRLGERAPFTTAREFESWLLRHVKGLPREVPRGMASTFEEADYSPRAMNRREFVQYLRALARVEMREQEVGR